jgi:hypothetical protein
MYKLSASSKKELKVYSVKLPSFEISVLHSIDCLSINSIYWCPDNTVLAVLLPNELLLLHQLEESKEQKVESFPLPEDNIKHCVFGYKTGRFVYLGGSNKIHILDRKERKYLDSISVRIL